MLYPAALAPCRAHILTLAMTVYLRKENCPQGDGNGVREREVVREGREEEREEDQAKTMEGGRLRWEGTRER